MISTQTKCEKTENIIFILRTNISPRRPVKGLFSSNKNEIKTIPSNSRKNCVAIEIILVCAVNIALRRNDKFLMNKIYVGHER